MKKLMIINDKMDKILASAEEFTHKKGPRTGLRYDECAYLSDAQNMTLFDAVYNAYNLGFRRGYNQAKKDLTGKPADQ